MGKMGIGFTGFLLKSRGASSFWDFSGVDSMSEWISDESWTGPFCLGRLLEKSKGDSCLIGVDVAWTFEDTIGD